MYYNFFKALKFAALIIFCSSKLYGQNTSVVDSLLVVLEAARTNVDRLPILISLSIEYSSTDGALALEYADEAYSVARALGDSAQIVKSGRIKGQLLRRFDKLNESIDVLSEVYPIAKRHRYLEDYKRILNALALAYTFKADYDKALDFNFESLVIRESEGNKSEVSIAQNNIGLVYFKLKNYDRAIEYYTKSLNMKKEAKTDFDLDFLLINLGLCYNKVKGDASKFLKAQDYINQALATCGDHCSDEIKISANFGLGVSFFELKQFEKSEVHFDTALAISRRTDNKRFVVENLVYLSQISIEQRDFDAARNNLIEAEGLSIESGYNQLLMDIYKQFSRLYSQTEDFRNASLYQDKYIQLKDSLISEDLIKNIAKIQTNFEERENIATIASKEVLIKQQRDLTIAVIAIALLTGLLVLVLQRSNRTIKKVNAQLSEAKEVIQEQNILLENKNKYLDKEVEQKTEDLERANQSLKQVNDELDNFIYKTSHDIRGPLASLKGMCNVALMDVKDPVALDYLRKLDATAERLNTILTRLLIINQINNSKLSLSKIDFTSIVKDVLLLEKKKGLPQKLTISRHIDENVYIQSDRELIRIVLENLIDNAIKFYNDSERVDSFVEIRINSEADGHVKVRVVDNGIGISESNPGKLFRMFFRASERSETGGIGLYIVKTATAKLGGKVGLLTTPEGFTEFFVVFPPVPPNPDDGPEKPSIY